jgi:ATP synthase protein I
MIAAGKRYALRLVSLQIAVSVVTALALLPVGTAHAWSGFAGGMIAAVSNGFLAARIFVPYKAQQTDRLLGGLYAAEMAKLLLVGLLFAGVILWVDPLSVAALFGVFLLVQILPVLATRFLE